MRELKRIALWPSRPGNSLAPWFLIAWRMLLLVPLMSCFALTTAMVLLSHGKDAAAQFWSDYVR